ncbi:MAG: DUF1080 domain-containing protein [Verrucomicrobiota bacterium]
MKAIRSMFPLWFCVTCTGLLWAGGARAADLVHAKDGSGVYGYKDTPKLPWCQWLVHDPDRPNPKPVDPGKAGPTAPRPADAIVLFDGQDVSKWEAMGDWKVADGCLVSGDSHFATKDHFGSIQLHVEWMGPAGFQGPWYNQGNNGVMLMGLFEIQIFDSYNEKIYPDGACGAVYGQTPPLVNATRPPGEWQTYDIIFIAPKFDGDKLVSPARVTVLQNGVLVQLNQEIYGETGHRIVPEYTHKSSTGPLAFGGHGCPVRFRNLWLRPLDAGS